MSARTAKADRGWRGLRKACPKSSGIRHLCLGWCAVALALKQRPFSSDHSGALGAFRPPARTIRRRREAQVSNAASISSRPTNWNLRRLALWVAVAGVAGLLGFAALAWR